MKSFNYLWRMVFAGHVYSLLGIVLAVSHLLFPNTSPFVFVLASACMAGALVNGFAVQSVMSNPSLKEFIHFAKNDKSVNPVARLATACHLPITLSTSTMVILSAIALYNMPESSLHNLPMMAYITAALVGGFLPAFTFSNQFYEVANRNCAELKRYMTTS